MIESPAVTGNAAFTRTGVGNSPPRSLYGASLPTPTPPLLFVMVLRRSERDLLARDLPRVPVAERLRDLERDGDAAEAGRRFFALSFSGACPRSPRPAGSLA